MIFSFCLKLTGLSMIFLCHCRREEKDRWIRGKYELCEFLPPLPYGDVALSQASGKVYIFPVSFV